MIPTKLSFDTKKKVWVLAAAPHILMRAKRVFAKASQGASKTLTLSDTPENARDLEWFLARYEPYEVANPTLLREKAQVHLDKETLVQKFLSNPQPARNYEMALPAREYQKAAAELFLTTNALLLADDLGTGKTVSAISALCDGRTLPALVVTMTSLPSQWEAQVNRFLPNLKTVILKKGTPYDLTKEVAKKYGCEPTFPDVVITNYHKLNGWAHTLSESGLHSVIYDEVQELRSGPDTKKYQAAELLSNSVSFRLGASATPISNYGGEFYHVLNVLFPDALGSHDEFLREWCKHTYGNKPKLVSPKDFREYLLSSGMMLQRTRKDIGRELPKLQRVDVPIEANLEVLNKVEDACMELARIILGEGEVKKGAKMLASEELSNKLRQATGISKAGTAAEFIRMLAESGEKILVFAWHRECYTILNSKLHDLKPVMYTGSETPKQKEASKKAFCEGDAQVMFMSLRSGAGLDGLQYACSTVVFVEYDWAYAVLEQGEARVYRDGQENPVVTYFLTADTGSDPAMVEVLGLKRNQLEGVMKHVDEIDDLEKLEVDPDHIKKLAMSYLRGKNVTVDLKSGEVV